MYSTSKKAITATVLSAIGLFVSFPATALHQVICYSGPNPWDDPLGPSPTLIARAQWDATDELVFDTHYMNTFANGAGCPNGTCTFLGPYFEPAINFSRFGTTTRYRYHVLYAGAGYYTLYSQAQGFVRDPATGQFIAGNEVRTCSVYGYVAQLRPQDFR